MESSISSAALGFGLKYTKIYRDKFGYICATDNGPVRIQRPEKSRGYSGFNTADIYFKHEIKELLHKNGLAVGRFLVSSQGTPYFKIGSDCFVATLASNGSNADFTNDEDFLAVVADVAKMHKILQNFDISSSKNQAAKTNTAAAKNISTMAQLKRKLLKSGKFSDFDMLFLKGCEQLLPHAEKYANIPTEYLTKGGYICHNLLKEENIYKTEDGQMLITNFSETGPGHYLFDLAYLIKRRIKSGAIEIMPLEKIIETYKKHHNAKNFDISIFIAILMFPEKFSKISIDYYSKKRTFAPKTYLKRMEECFKANEELLKYI